MKKHLLVLGMMAASFASFGQEALREGFEGATFPPEGWTVESTNATNNWTLLNDPQIVAAGNQSAGVNWIAETQDESLISPEFSLEGFTSAYFNFTAVVGYEYMVSPNDNGDLFAKISTDGGSTWTELWSEQDEGVYTDYDPRIKHLDISSYIGETTVKIKFQYVANDADIVAIDDVSVTGCPGLGLTSLTTTDLTDTSATFALDGTSSSYGVEYGTIGFELGTGDSQSDITTSFSFADLEPGTGYDFYLVSNCTETANSGWYGPYTFYTTLSTPADLDYGYGFESVPFAAAGWAVANNGTGNAWNRYTGSDAIPTHEGDFMSGVIGAAEAADTWLFSRGLNMTEGDEISLVYYIKMAALAGEGNVNSLTVTYGDDRTAAAQSTVLNSHDNVTNTDWSYNIVTFTAPTTGVYYLGFHCDSPAHTAENQGALLLDSVQVDSLLGTEDVFASNFAVYPNPANDVVNISANAGLNNVQIVDINGRTVKSAKFDGANQAQINISDLASGVYIMNIASDKGTTSQKIVKN